MNERKKIKVIFDTNIWISFLIGKKLQSIQNLIENRAIEIILSDQLIAEIALVTQRAKLKKYFPEDKVKDLMVLLKVMGSIYAIKGLPKNKHCRDPKDNFLLDLIEQSHADYLVTGDRDLHELKTFMTAKILSPDLFEKEIIK